MICPKCGKKFKNSKFCRSCGTQLVEENNVIITNPAVIPTVDPNVGSLDVQLVNRKVSEYTNEALLADKVYKSYVTHGVSRLDKVNGRFLASQTIKLDVLIEQNKQLIDQNNMIIKLLQMIYEK